MFILKEGININIHTQLVYHANNVRLIPDVILFQTEKPCRF